MHNEKRISILTINHIDSLSETFIKAHVDYISGKKYVLYGAPLPYLTDLNGKLNVKYSFLIRVLLKIGLIYPDWNLKQVAIYQYLKQNKIDIIFAEYGITGAEVLNVCKKLRIPIVVHFHGFDASHSKTLSKYMNSYKNLFEYCSYIFCVSNPMLKKLKDIGADERKLIYNPYGVDDGFFKITPNYSSKCFLAIGRFVEKKAPHLTIAAFKILHDRYPEAKLVMVGDGIVDSDLSEICKDLVKVWDLDESIEFKGKLFHHEIKTVMKNSFCFLQHSVTTKSGDSEGTPVAILEASASGLPVISTFHAGIPEIIKHNKTGFLVNEKDITKMAEYMMKLYENRKLAEKMGRLGKEFTDHNFRMKKHIDVINSYIDKALQNDKNS